ncbi:hypothetical protein BX265_0340 [Streptomyces sp. TLI_235]|nr:hypothetical protein [Streptomyces sp. TLI_235]PBC75669.1 hypothetical protein BX265_0340 [Streptomyces sp. TLI_235]
MSTSSTRNVSRQAGDQFRTGRDFVVEDASLRRLHYHLLRLTLAGLTQAEVDDLSEYARLAFSNADTSAKADTIRGRADASRLAVAVVDIVEQSGPRDRRGQVLLGAILGAHAGLDGDRRDGRSTDAVTGAVGGAVAVATTGLVTEMIDQVGITDYLATET